MGSYGYQAAQEIADECKLPGPQLKLENHGDRAIVVFTKGPYGLRQLWPDDLDNSLDADSDEGRAYLEEHPDAKKHIRFRCRYAVFVIAEIPKRSPMGKAKPETILEHHDALSLMAMAGDNERFWEGTKTFMGDAELAEMRKPFAEHVYELERSGAAGSAKTKYNLYPIIEISKVNGLAKAITMADPIDLENPFPDEDDNDPGKGKGRGKGKGGSGSKGSTSRTRKAKETDKKSASKGEALVSDKQKGQLVALARKLGADKLVEILAEFGVPKISSLPAAKFDVVLREMESALDAPAPAEEEPENDPFA